MLKFEKQNQKQLRTIVRSSFNLADAFSLTPPLRIFKQERFSTQIGKFASISMLVIFVIQFIVALQGVLNHQFVSVVTKQVNSVNTEVHFKNIKPMYFTPNNFTLVLSFMNTSQIPIPNIIQLLNMTIQNCQTLRSYNSTGGLTITRKYKLKYKRCYNYPIEVCTMANHFPTEAQQSMFITKNISNYYCISSEAWKKRSIVLNGVGTDNDYQYINVLATICSNTTESKNCASQSEIESKLSLVYYGYYYNDLVAQMDSVHEPLKSFVKLNTAVVSRLQTKTIQQNNQIQQTQTDTGYIFENWIQQNGVSIYNYQTSSDPYNGQYVLQHIIQQYNIIMNYKRTYQKVQTILGQLGGLWQIMYYGILLVIYPIIAMNMNMALANKLFSFSQEDNNEGSPNSIKSSIIVQQSIFKQPEKKKIDLNDHNDLARFLKTKKSSLNMSIKVILLQLCGCREQEKQQLDYAKKKILNKLDVSYILTKLMEIDKLKQILLTKDQRHLFNHLPKPTIPKALFNSHQRVAIEANPKHEIILQEEKSDLMKLQEAFAAYKNIKNKPESELSPIDQKLVNQMDTDIHNLFIQIEQEAQDLPNSSPFKRYIVQSMESSNVRQELLIDSKIRPILTLCDIDQEEQAQLPR